MNGDRPRWLARRRQRAGLLLVPVLPLDQAQAVQRCMCQPGIRNAAITRELW